MAKLGAIYVYKYLMSSSSFSNICIYKDRRDINLNKVTIDGGGEGRALGIRWF